MYIYIICCNMLWKCFILQHAECSRIGLLLTCASSNNAFGPQLEALKQLRKCCWSVVTKTRHFSLEAC